MKSKVITTLALVFVFLISTSVNETQTYKNFKRKLIIFLNLKWISESGELD